MPVNDKILGGTTLVISNIAMQRILKMAVHAYKHRRQTAPIEHEQHDALRATASTDTVTAAAAHFLETSNTAIQWDGINVVDCENSSTCTQRCETAIIEHE